MQHRKISRWASRWLLMLALAAITATPAQARHAPAERALATPPVRLIDAATRHHHPESVQPPTRIVIAARADGFDWGDAGIGASGALGAVLLVGGSALLIKRNDRRAIKARFES
jgi:uncharacterized iron-regulated membrane protein